MSAWHGAGATRGAVKEDDGRSTGQLKVFAKVQHAKALVLTCGHCLALCQAEPSSCTVLGPKGQECKAGTQQVQHRACRGMLE